MGKSSSQMGQHKRMAMGESVGFKKGGTVGCGGMGGGKALKTGMPDSPLTVSKQQNGVPGYKKGGKSK